MQCGIITNAQTWCFPVTGCHGHVSDRVAVWTGTLRNGDCVVGEHFNWFLNGLFLEGPSVGSLLQPGDPSSPTTCLTLSGFKHTVLNKLLCVADTWSVPRTISIFSNSCTVLHIDQFTTLNYIKKQSIPNFHCLLHTVLRNGFFFCSYALFLPAKEFPHLLYIVSLICSTDRISTLEVNAFSINSALKSQIIRMYWILFGCI